MASSFKILKMRGLLTGFIIAGIATTALAESASVETETANFAGLFSDFPLPPSPSGIVTANPYSGEIPLSSLTDGALALDSGPSFGKGVKTGAYKMDLGEVKPVSAITSWSYSQTPACGCQKITLYGSNSPTDPGWDLSQFTRLGTIDTTDQTGVAYHAASLQAPEGKSLGDFRWIVWSVSPVTADGEHTAFQELAVSGVSMGLIEVESVDSVDAFSKCPLPGSPSGVVTANQKTANTIALSSLTDGILREAEGAEGYGPVFGNGVKDGAYKMDLGAVKTVRKITSWSCNLHGRRGAQKIKLYGSSSATDPGWDLSQFTPIGMIDTTGHKPAKFNAASLRARDGKPLGDFRWIVWSVSPISTAGGGENTAIHELTVE